MTVSETEGGSDGPSEGQVASPPGEFSLPLPPGYASSAQLQFTHQGPLPPHQQLAGYEQAHPGAAAWILKEAEASATHTREMERLALRYQARDALLHRILPFVLVATLLVISALMAIFANAVLGGVAFFGTLASVVTVYLKGSMGTKQ